MNTSNDTSPRTPILNRFMNKIHSSSPSKSPAKERDDYSNGPLYVRELFNNKEFSDMIVVLRCDGESDVEIHCHALILSKNATLDSLIKQQKNMMYGLPLVLTFDLDSCQLVPFRLVLQHLYGIRILPSSIQEILVVLSLAKEYKVESLMNEYRKLLSISHPRDVKLFLQSDFFTSLRVEQVVEILGNDDLPIEDEQVVYEVACKYLREHPEVDASILKRVIKFPPGTRLEDSFAFSVEKEERKFSLFRVSLKLKCVLVGLFAVAVAMRLFKN